MVNEIIASVAAVVLASVIGFCSWLNLKIARLETKIAEIETAMKSKDKDCAAHHEWMEKISKQISDTREDVSFLRGRFERRGSVAMKD